MQPFDVTAVSTARVSVMEISFDAAVREWACAAFAAERAPKHICVHRKPEELRLPSPGFLGARYSYWCQLVLALAAWCTT